MTQYHYLASKSLLEKDGEKFPHLYIYQSGLDFLNPNFEMNVDQDKDINKLFPYSIRFNSTCKFQVATSKGDIPLKVEEQNNCYETKSLKILYDYILNASKNGDTLELYTVWTARKIYR